MLIFEIEGVFALEVADYVGLFVLVVLEAFFGGDEDLSVVVEDRHSIFLGEGAFDGVLAGVSTQVEGSRGSHGAEVVQSAIGFCSLLLDYLCESF